MKNVLRTIPIRLYKCSVCNKIQNNIQTISETASDMFSNISDYIWKVPRLIRSEEKIELKKLETYYPDSDDIVEHARSMLYRDLRWQREERKLKIIFPDAMAASNLFLILSHLEFFCLQLCKEIEKVRQKKLSNARGYGIGRLFNYLIISEIDIAKICFYKQIIASTKIRNCLMHANGVISLTKKDYLELKRVVKSGEYYRKFDDTKAKDRNRYVSISSSSFGEQLKIKNEYPFMVSGYAERFFVELCRRAESAL